MKISFLLGGIVLFAAGGVLGWFLHAPGTPALPDASLNDSPKKTRIADVGNDPAREALRRRVKELERQLAERSAPAGLESKTNERPARAEQVKPPRNFGPDGFLAHLEEMRTKDPARYTQITNGMARFRARMLSRAQNRLDVLASVDTSNFSAAERETHDKLQEIIAREQELMESARPDSDLSAEERRKAFEELHELHREKAALEKAERETLLKETARSFGLKGQDAAELVDTVKSVYQATQSGHGPDGHGPGGPPPPRN